MTSFPLIFFATYISGFILSYFMLRKDSRKDLGDSYSYEEVKSNIFASLFSWLTVIIFLAVRIWDKLDNIKSKPPKFL